MIKLNDLTAFAVKKGYYENGFLVIPLKKIEKEYKENQKDIKRFYAIENDNEKRFEVMMLRKKIIW